MKRIIAVILSLAIILPVFSLTSFAGETDASASIHITDIGYDGTVSRMVISYTTELTEETTATAIIAGYKNGALKGVDEATFTIYPDRTQTEVDSDVRWYRSDLEYKLFVWDGFEGMQAMSEEIPVLHTPEPIGRLEDGEHYGWVMNADLTGETIKLRVMTDNGKAETLGLADTVDYWAPNAMQGSGSLMKSEADTEIKKLFYDYGGVIEDKFPSGWARNDASGKVVAPQLRGKNGEDGSYSLRGVVTSTWTLTYMTQGSPVTLAKYETNSEGEITKLYFAVSTACYDYSVYDNTWANANWSEEEWQAAYKELMGNNTISTMNDFKYCLGWAIQPDQLDDYRSATGQELTREDIAGVKEHFISSSYRNRLFDSGALIIDMSANLKGAAPMGGLVNGYKITDDVTEFRIPNSIYAYGKEAAYRVQKNVSKIYNSTSGSGYESYAADPDMILPGVLIRFTDDLTMPVNPADISTSANLVTMAVDTVTPETGEDGNAIYIIKGYTGGQEKHIKTTATSALADVTGYNTSSRKYVTDGTLWDARSEKELTEYLHKGDIIFSDGVRIIRVRNARDVYTKLSDGDYASKYIATSSMRNNFFFDTVKDFGSVDGMWWLEFAGGMKLNPDEDMKIDVVNIDLNVGSAEKAVSISNDVTVKDLKPWSEDAAEYDYAFARTNSSGILSELTLYRIKTKGQAENPPAHISTGTKLDDGEHYGWVMNADLTDETVKLRVMTDNGEAEMLGLAESVDYWAPNAAMGSGRLVKSVADTEIKTLFDSHGNADTDKFPSNWNKQIAAGKVVAPALRGKDGEDGSYSARGVVESIWRLACMAKGNPITLIKYKTNPDGEITKLYFATTASNYDYSVYDNAWANANWTEEEWQAAYKELMGNNTISTMDDFKYCLGWAIQPNQLEEYKYATGQELTREDIAGVKEHFNPSSRVKELKASDALLVDCTSNLKNNVLLGGLVNGYKITDDATEFSVPDAANYYNREDLYTVRKNAAERYNTTTPGATRDCFAADAEEILPGVIVRFTEDITKPVDPTDIDIAENIPMMVVESVDTERSDDGETIYTINGYTGGDKRSVRTTSRSALADVSYTVTTSKYMGTLVWNTESQDSLRDHLYEGDIIITDGEHILRLRSARDVYNEIKNSSGDIGRHLYSSAVRNIYHFDAVRDYDYIDGIWWLRIGSMKISPDEEMNFDVVEINLSKQSAETAVSVLDDEACNIQGVMPQWSYDEYEYDYAYVRLKGYNGIGEIVLYRITGNED